MKTCLLLLALISLSAQAAMPDGPLGGGSFQGEAQWNCSTQEGYQCALPREIDYPSVSMQISETEIDWNAGEWAYKLSLIPMGHGSYLVSERGHKLGVLKCKNLHCRMDGDHFTYELWKVEDVVRVSVVDEKEYMVGDKWVPVWGHLSAYLK